MRAVHLLLCCVVGLTACRKEPTGTARQSVSTGEAAASEGHPTRYYLVSARETVSLDASRKPMARGFAVAVKTRVRERGRWIAVTKTGLRLPLHDLRPAKASTFRGIALKRGRIDSLWVIRAGAPLLNKPEHGSSVVGRKKRLTALPLISRDGPEGYLQVRGGWMRTRDVALPTLRSRPALVGDDERWLDVSLASQTLVAYQGDRAVFATLISGGVGAKGTTFATPPGLHRIVSKLLGATMDNLEHTGVVPYFYEEVPFSQYIGRVALHGVYWHDRFGHPMSHGCINLSLSDAEFLFSFTRPELPKGQSEVPAAGGGTVVSIRD